MELQRIAIEALVSGCPDSFVDLFYLACSDGPSRAGDLTEIGGLLMKAEASSRSDDTETTVSCYNRVAAHFLAAGRVKTAIFYFEKSLSAARRSGDKEREGATLSKMGTAFENTGEYESAAKYHEARQRLALEAGNADESAASSSRLVHVKMSQGNACSAAGDVEGALVHYTAAVAAAFASSSETDTKARAEATFEAGRCYVILGRASEGLPLLQQHVDMVLAEASLESGRPRAFACMAAAHLSCSNLEEARLCLEKLLGLTDASNESNELAEAIEARGLLYLKLGENEKALKQLKRALKIRRNAIKVGLPCDRVKLDSLSLTIGNVAAASSFEDKVSVVLSGDLKTLLKL